MQGHPPAQQARRLLHKGWLRQTTGLWGTHEKARVKLIDL